MFFVILRQNLFCREDLFMPSPASRIGGRGTALRWMRGSLSIKIIITPHSRLTPHLPPKLNGGRLFFGLLFIILLFLFFLSFILFLPFLIEPVDFGVNTLEIVTSVNRLTMTLDSVAPLKE